ncbi:hypothetical protein LOD99_12869 [Oopsacas minuta]|uniref:Uncharacterized protein n=1 Tax=Oopsacas minuta TaxID=111878 RepID=A0AAV7JDJ8_9METZ|nr:hypothetical protein LOD99_12869 [Oopsacas minuta]
MGAKHSRHHRRHKKKQIINDNMLGEVPVNFTTFSENPFAQKVRRYLSSIEQEGDITNLTFSFGNLSLKTGDGEYNVEVSEEGDETLISLEDEVNSKNTFLLYTYNSTAKRLNHCSFLYITDVYSSKSKVHILQANTDRPYGKPSFVSSRILTPNYHKLFSPYSRFVGTFHSETVMQSMITFVTPNMEIFYLAKNDTSLNLTDNGKNAVLFTFTPHKQHI